MIDGSIGVTGVVGGGGVVGTVGGVTGGGATVVLDPDEAPVAAEFATDVVFTLVAPALVDPWDAP